MDFIIIIFYSDFFSFSFLFFLLYEKRQRNQRANGQRPLGHGKSKRVPEKRLLLLRGLCPSLCLRGSR